jgi:hypothetical protein
LIKESASLTEESLTLAKRLRALYPAIWNSCVPRATDDLCMDAVFSGADAMAGKRTRAHQL